MLDRLFPARCPIDEPTKKWLTYRFDWLLDRFGPAALHGTVATPTARDFPERFDGSMASLQSVLRRVGDRLGVDASTVDLNLYEGRDKLDELAVEFGGAARWDGAAGTYQEQYDGDSPRYSVSIERSVAANPTLAVATMAHELCHALLLGGRHIAFDEEDCEPLTDVTAVFFGFGVFIANSLVTESTTPGVWGWSVGRQGYLTYPILGYALALCAARRGEAKPAWARYMRPDAMDMFRKSARYLRKHGAAAEEPRGTARREPPPSRAARS